MLCFGNTWQMEKHFDGMCVLLFQSWGVLYLWSNTLYNSSQRQICVWFEHVFVLKSTCKVLVTLWWKFKKGKIKLDFKLNSLKQSLKAGGYFLIVKSDYVDLCDSQRKNLISNQIPEQTNFFFFAGLVVICVCLCIMEVMIIGTEKQLDHMT